LLVVVFHAKEGKSFILWGEQKIIPLSTIMDVLVPSLPIGPEGGVRGCYG
jgi:hypothetical protein